MGLLYALVHGSHHGSRYRTSPRKERPPFATRQPAGAAGAGGPLYAAIEPRTSSLAVPSMRTQDVPRHAIARPQQAPQRGLFTPPSLSRVHRALPGASPNVAGQVESGHGTGRAPGGGCRGGALERDEAANEGGLSLRQ